MKVLIAQFLQESNSFSSVLCGLDRFKDSYFAYGDKLFEELGHKSTEIAGAIDALQEAKIEIVPSMAMQACSDGPVRREAYNYFKETLYTDIDNNLPLDGLFLSLHGATVFEDAEDGMGTLLQELRMKVGEEIVIAISLDLHANVTPQMVRNVNIIRGYKTYPHNDLYNAGFDATKMLIETIIGKIVPKMLAFRIPMIVQSERTQTTSCQMAVISRMAKEAEENPKILSVSYFQVQPWLDVADMGCTIIVIGDNDMVLAEEIGKRIAKYFWDIKDSFKIELPSFDDALRMAAETDDLIIISDPSDSPSSGSTGDSNVIMKKYIERKVPYKTYMLVVDPETVGRAIEIGVGNRGTFQIGGKINIRLYSPASIDAKVKIISDGTFTLEGEWGKGKEYNMGRSVVLQYENLYILVMEKAVSNNDPGPYISMGLDPAKAKMVLVKSPAQYRSAFKKYTDKMVEIAAPGSAASYFWELPFQNLRGPIYPFDSIVDFEPKLSALGYGISLPE